MPKKPLLDKKGIEIRSEKEWDVEFFGPTDQRNPLLTRDQYIRKQNLKKMQATAKPFMDFAGKVFNRVGENFGSIQGFGEESQRFSDYDQRVGSGLSNHNQQQAPNRQRRAPQRRPARKAKKVHPTPSIS